MLYKVDISRAFRHVKLDPMDYDLLGLRHDRHYLDTCLPFGYRNGIAIFYCISDTVHHMMRQRHFDVINDIDDIHGIEVPSKFDALRQLLHALGFDISLKKLEKSSTRLNCLGIVVDTKTFTLSICSEKFNHILAVCDAWHQKTHCTKRELQSLLGSLLYVSVFVSLGSSLTGSLTCCVPWKTDVELGLQMMRYGTSTGFSSFCPNLKVLTFLIKEQ